MRLSERELMLLDYLLVTDEYSTYKDLSKVFNLTERMVRYDIKKIDLFLEKNQLMPLNRSLKKGIMIGKRDEVAQLLRKFKQRATPKAYKYSKTEIEEFIFLTLLITDVPVPVSYFEETLFISRTSVLNTIKSLNRSYQFETLKLVHIKRKGYKIEGNLLEVCHSFTSLLLEAINLREFYTFIETEEVIFSKKAELLIFNLFNLDILFDSYEDVKVIERFMGKDFDDSFNTLVLTILYKIKIVHPQWELLDFMTKNKNELNDLELLLRLMINESPEVSMEKSGVILKKYIKDLTKVIAERFEKSASDFSPQFYEQLNAHVLNMINRNRKGIKVTNPIYNEILTDYKDLFYYVKQAVEPIEETYKIIINDQEISFLVIYFASEIENLNVSLVKKPNVLVVCVEGLAVSKMIRVQLNKFFEFNKIDTSSLKKFSKKDLHDYDFIISTVEIPDIDSEKILTISNYLTKDDLDLLKSFFNMKLISNKEPGLSKFNKIMETIRENTNEITNLSKLELDLIKILTKKDKLNKKDIIPEIYFGLESISIIEERMRWEEAIRIGTKALEEKQATLPTYHERIMTNIRIHGPYMVIAPKVMIVHAGMEDGVIHPGLYITVLKNGMNMKGNFPEEVQLLITIGLKDTSTHRIMENIAKLAFDKEKIKEILEATDENDIFNMVVSTLYK